MSFKPGVKSLEVSPLSKVEAGTSGTRDSFIRAEEELQGSGGARYRPLLITDKEPLLCALPLLHLGSVNIFQALRGCYALGEVAGYWQRISILLRILLESIN